MSLAAAGNDSASEIHIPADIDWEMLDKSKFFILGAALFSGVSGTLYPIVVLKTRQQVMLNAISCFKIATSVFRNEGYRGFYSGFGTSLMGTIPARALYMGALEITKSNVGNLASVRLGLSDASASAIASGAAGVTSAMAAQLVWTPVDVVSQRLMVGSGGYNGGFDAFRKILYSDGVRGLYRGFGISILTYAPSNALWWASYSVSHRLIWDCIGCKRDESRGGYRPGRVWEVAAQGLGAVAASGVSALVTTPLDTIKTRLQVMEGEKRTVLETLRNLVKEGGIGACYRGLGPRWASMSMSATTMVTTYEFLKKLSTKNQESFC